MKRSLLSSLPRGGGLAVLALLAILAAPMAHATGTPSGTTITNQATLSYSVGTVSQSDIPSTVASFVVDTKVNLSVTTSDSSAVSAVPGQSAVTTTFSLSNTGNNTQDFALSVASLTVGAQQIYGASQNVTFTVVPANCTISVGGSVQSYIANLVPDVPKTVTVACAIPSSASNGAIAGISLTAEARTAGSNNQPAGVLSQVAATTTTSGGVTTTTPGIVFADGAGSDDGARDAKFSARSAYKVVTAALSVTKSVANVCDPVNGATSPTNIPGAYVQYIVAITNTGSRSATLAQVTDTLNSNLSFDPDFIKGTDTVTTPPTPGVNCAAGVNPTSATGKGFKIVNAGRATAGATYPKFLTSAGGSGATFAGSTFTIDFSTVLPAEVGYTAGELKVNETVQVIFQTKIN